MQHLSGEDGPVLLALLALVRAVRPRVTRFLCTRQAPPTQKGRFRVLCLAELTGFEPAISCVTGRHVRPLHHSSIWLRGQDSNLRPSGYEPDELPTAPPRAIVMKMVGGNGLEPLTPCL
jgi:hypothetical protein